MLNVINFNSDLNARWHSLILDVVKNTDKLITAEMFGNVRDVIQGEGTESREESIGITKKLYRKPI